MARLSSRTRLILLVLLLVAWAWRLHGLDFQSLWRDEVDSLRFATRPLAQVLANFTRPGENGPLYFLLLRPWIELTGRSEYALRFPSAWAGVLAAPLLWAWGRRLFDERVALVAVAFLVVNPYHLWYSQEAKMYALLMVVVMLALWAFAEALERGKFWRWVLWLILTSLCFYIHVLGALVIPLQTLWLLMTPRWRRRWRAYAAALAALVLPYLPLIWWQWALLTNPNFRTGHPFVTLPRMLLLVSVAQVQGIPRAPSTFLLAAPIFLLLAALFLDGRYKLARRLTLTWWFLPLLALFAISLMTPLFTDRYLIWTLPAMLLMLAAGAMLTADQNRWVAAALALLLVSFQLWNGWRETTVPIKSDFRAAAAYVQPRREEGDLTIFLMPYIRYTYRYYDPGPYPWAEPPYANRPADIEQLPQRMQTLLDGYSGAWLIESEPEFYDREGRIRAWLEQNGVRDAEAHFARVSVYHYRFEE